MTFEMECHRKSHEATGQRKGHCQAHNWLRITGVTEIQQDCEGGVVHYDKLPWSDSDGYSGRPLAKMYSRKSINGMRV